MIKTAISNKTNLKESLHIVKELQQIFLTSCNLELINNKLNELQLIRDSLTIDEEESLKINFRLIMSPIIFQSQFCKYSNIKPRGYTGDFGAMELIWNAQNNEKLKFRGTSELGKKINAVTLSMDNCVANGKRVWLLKKFIDQYKNANIASIGSGSGIEIIEHYKTNKTNNFTLFDQDPMSYALFSHKLKTLDSALSKKTEFKKGNVYKSVLQDKSEYSFIYSSGLFDYLNMDSAIKLAKILWGKVKSGGQLLITNAHPDNPTKLWMEYVGDWWLLYKTKQEMESISNALEGVTKLEYIIDDNNVYQYIIMTKK